MASRDEHAACTFGSENARRQSAAPLVLLDAVRPPMRRIVRLRGRIPARQSNHSVREIVPSRSTDATAL
jgi:hypothetical protein